MSKPENTPIRKDRKRALKDVEYEISMFIETARTLPTLKEGTVMHDAVLESFLVHARNLIHFFYKVGKQYRRDVLSSHYSYPRPNPEETSRLREWAERMNTRLAHLSYNRLEASKDWPVPEIVAKLKPTIESFGQNVKAPDCTEYLKFFLSDQGPVQGVTSTASTQISVIVAHPKDQK